MSQKPAAKQRDSRSSRVQVKVVSEDSSPAKAKKGKGKKDSKTSAPITEIAGKSGKVKASRADRKAQTREVREIVVKRNGKTRRIIVRGSRKKLVPQEDVRLAKIPEIPLNQAKFAYVSPLKGSHESLVRQNTRTFEDGLERIENDEELERLVRGRELVSLPASSHLLVNPSMEGNRRYCRPWTSRFLEDLAGAHYQRYRRPLMVNSAVRTVEYQRRLLRVNGNAAPAEGDVASPHLTGATIDIAKKGLSLSEVGWLRAYLLPLQQAGRIDVEEEFQQACFHISVYKSYSSGSSPQRSRAPFLATGVR